MDLVLALKFLHVAAVILWLGAGFGLMLAGLLMGRKARPQDILALLRILSFLGPRLFRPAGLATLASGLALTLLGGAGWPAWVVTGLAGFAFTALFGARVLGRGTEAALAAAEASGPAAAVAPAQRLFRLAQVDYAVQFAIVFLMVVKPGWSEIAVLSGLAAVVVLAALAAFRPVPDMT